MSAAPLYPSGGEVELPGLSLARGAGGKGVPIGGREGKWFVWSGLRGWGKLPGRVNGFLGVLIFGRRDEDRFTSCNQGTSYSFVGGSSSPGDSSSIPAVGHDGRPASMFNTCWRGRPGLVSYSVPSDVKIAVGGRVSTPS